MIVCDCMVDLDTNFFVFKTKKPPHFFSGVRRSVFLSYVIMQAICNKFIEVNFCVSQPNRLLQH